MSQPVVKKRGLSRVSLILACATALFSSGYSNYVIGVVVTLLKEKFGTEAISAHNFSTVLSSVAYAGIIVGQLGFGYISDRFGRKFGMMASTGFIAVFAILSATSSEVHGNLHSLLAQLTVWRFMIGIGVGAEYPSGSVAASEQSEEPGISRNAQHRWVALATITMIDLGFVFGAFVPLVLLWIFGEDHLNIVWRGSLGLGTLPAIAVFFWRLRMEEPIRYRKDSMKHTAIPYWLIIKRYWLRLAAISVVWFLYDFITYPFGLYSSIVLKGIDPTSTLIVTLGLNVVITLFSMPGALLGSFAVDWLGPKNTQIVGLVFQAIIGFIMSGAYKQLVVTPAAFAVVYGIFQSFGEFGPGVCTIILAAKTGPTAVRGQFYGVAAAAGKVGAFIGVWVFPPIIDAFSRHGTDPARGNTGPFWLGSAVAILSAIITYFFVQPLTHDGMEREDIAFRAYLEENGFDTSRMGLLDSKEVDSVDEKVKGDGDNASISKEAA